MSGEQIKIYPSESVYYELDVSEALPPGSTSVASATATAHKVTSSGTLGDAYSALLSSSSCVIVGNKIRFKIVLALAGERYRVEIAATTNDAQIFKSRLFFNCAGA